LQAHFSSAPEVKSEILRSGRNDITVSIQFLSDPSHAFIVVIPNELIFRRSPSAQNLLGKAKVPDSMVNGNRASAKMVSNISKSHLPIVLTDVSVFVLCESSIL
jgi:hypothetical protein